MKKFTFSLKALLSYREHVEHMVRQEVATLQREILDCNERIDALLKEADSVRGELDLLCQAGIGADKYRFYSEYIDGVKLKVDDERQLLEKLDVYLKTKQAELLQKSVDRKVLENLRDKKKREYFENLEKVLQEESDEMALIQRSRS